MTIRTREKRRRRKALARWWKRRLNAIFADFEKQVATAREEMRALSVDAFVFGRMVVEHGPARTVRRVPPSEWTMIANPPHPDGTIARERNAARRPDFAPIVIDDPRPTDPPAGFYETQEDYMRALGDWTRRMRATR